MQRIADDCRDRAHSNRNSIWSGLEFTDLQLIRNAERTDLNALIDDDRSGGIERASELRKGVAASYLAHPAKECLHFAPAHIGFVNETLTVIVRRKINRLAIRSPSQRPRAPVQVRGYLASTISTYRRNPNVAVFRDAIDRCDVAPGGGVSDPFPIRRPRRFVFAARCLRNLTYLGLQIDGEDIGVVIRVRIGFVI